MKNIKLEIKEIKEYPLAGGGSLKVYVTEQGSYVEGVNIRPSQVGKNGKEIYVNEKPRRKEKEFSMPPGAYC